MAITQVSGEDNLNAVTEIKTKAEDLQAVVRNSLSLQATGGSHIANELTRVVELAKALGAEE